MRFRPEIAEAIIDISEGRDPEAMHRARWAVVILAFGYALRDFCRAHELETPAPRAAEDPKR